MKYLKKLFKGLLYTTLFLILSFFVLYLIYNESLPEGREGAEAEALTQKMFEAIDKPAWDSTHYVAWSFRDAHHFIWDKKAHKVQVSWSNYRVLLNPNKVTGKVYYNGTETEAESAKSVLNKAYTHFINDAFWLNAPALANQEGTKRSVVDLDDGAKGLMITYTKGGVTPGDSYLWIFDETGKPKAWKMWVSIIPIGGVDFDWGDWQTLSTGAKLASSHNGILNIPITNIKGGMLPQDVGIEPEHFVAID